MLATLRIRRFNPDKAPEPYWQDFEVKWTQGAVLLEALHDIQENRDGTLAYRYSCRGAICGSCAMRINGGAALACKVQLSALDTRKPVVIEPLLNSHVIKDLVVDQEPFFDALRSVLPWLSESRLDPRQPFTLDATMGAAEKDQFLRATDCIMCQSCFSDCPKRQQAPRFIGPAACLAAYKRIHHPQEPNAAERLRRACEPGGIGDCDRHANCVKVCPKDCRPMRAILFLQRQAKEAGVAPG